MGKQHFLNKSYCELSITSLEDLPEKISQELDIIHMRFYKKGDTYGSKYSNSVGRRKHNLWAINSKTIISEAEDISPHLSYLKSIVSNKVDVLKKYKADPDYEIILWVWIETDNAGIGLDLMEKEIEFIHNIFNRVHFSLLTNANIEE